MRTKPSSIPRIPAIDGLRGIAVLLVLATHSFFAATSQRLDSIDRVSNLVVRLGGLLGVDLFFVVSGFLITAILDHTRNADKPFSTFYIRRILRIVPLYYAFLFVIPIAFVKLGPTMVGTPESRMWDWAFLTNVLMTRYTPAEIGMIFSSFWSLAIEEQFYLFWPLVILLARRKWLVPICLGLIGFSLVSRAALTLSGHGAYGWLLLPSRFDGLAAGALVALLSARNPELLDRWAPKVMKASMFLLPAFMAGIVGLFWHNDAALPETLRTIYFPRRLEIIFEPFLAAMAFASVIAVIARRPAGARRRWLESRTLATVSRYSYGMYTLHVVVILLVIYFGVPIRNPAFGLDLPWQLAFAAIVVSGCLVGGFLSWHLWEKWFLKAAPAYTYARGDVREESPSANPSSEALPLPAP